MFSNQDLVQGRIHNYRHMQERRIVFQLGITYDTPPGKVEAVPTILREVVEAHENVRFDRAHFKEFGPSRRFLEQGIAFAFPSQTLYLAR